MIIVEGLDRCGKSSVTKRLLELLPSWSYRHHTKPPMSPYGYFAGFLADCRPHVIVDRLHWSEPAYGNTYRGGSGLSRAETIKLELMCLAHDATVIYMHDSPESIESRWDDSEMFPADGIRKLIAEYEKVIQESRIPYSRHKLHDLVKDGSPTELLARLASSEIHAANASLMCPPPSIGSGRLSTAEFFVIGPTPTLRGAEKDPDVQFPLPLGHAENEFWEMAAHFPWHKGYYTSASSYSIASLKRLVLTPEINDSVRPIVICLGKEAELAAVKALYSWPIISLPHPAHGLRTMGLESWSDDFLSAIKTIGAH